MSQPGYWASAWPGEDGGRLRRQAPATGAGLAVGAADQLAATDRDVFGTTMLVQRDAGELFAQGASMGDGTAWVERIDPVSLSTLSRSPDLPAGPWWPGGVAVHQNGSLYVTQGRWCHRLDTDCSVVAARELPRNRPYNSLLILPDGHLVMKDFIVDGAEGSELVVLEPEGLEIVARLVLPEGSIARLSALDHRIVVVGDHSLFVVAWDGRRLTLDDRRAPYRAIDGQTFGWDAVLDLGAAWFLDNGAGSELFGGCFRGKTASSAPLHLVRVDLDSRTTELFEICGEPGGIVANPPVVDGDRRIVVGYDSGHGVMRAWRVTDEGLDDLWRRQQNHAGHMIRWADTGELLTFDFDVDRGFEQVVIVDIETGEERARVATASPVQSVLFPCPGWQRDAYVVTFTTITRVSVA
jgi:hypothetical protein